MENEKMIVKLSRSNDSGFSDSYVWAGTDATELKQFVKDIVMEDAFVKDILSDNPDMDHQEGLADYIRDFFDEKNNTWEGVMDFSIKDQGCCIDLEEVNKAEILDEIKEYWDIFMTIEEFKKTLDDDRLKELAKLADITIYDPDDVDDLMHCLENIEERKWS